MRSPIFRCIGMALALITLRISPVFAQRGVLSGETQRVGSRNAEKVPLALEGYCAVCLMRGHRWVKGTSKHSTIYDGRRYFFPSEDEKQAFVKAPSQYAPVLNGDSVVAYASSGKRVAGNIRFGTLNKGRLYLFQSEAEKQRFSAKPKRYLQADLADGGQCVVCRSHGGNMTGKPEFSARYDGIRYWFPSDRQQTEFLANPAKYAVASTAATAVAGSGASCPCGSKNCKACRIKGRASVGGVPVPGVQQIAVRGTTACATCKYGVPPLGVPKTLGLAVETNDGKVYIVEDADRLYPKIYKGRFQELPVELKGQVLQTKGKFVWVKPTSVKTVR